MKVLLFETERTLGVLYKEIFETQGIEICLTCDLKKFEKAAKSPWDYVIAALPFCRQEARKLLQTVAMLHVPVVVITSGSEAIEDAKKLVGSGRVVRVVYPKPFEPTDILRLFS